MLGKTAGGLFWMSRYLERSKNIARLVDAGFRIALTQSYSANTEWASIIATTGIKDAYEAVHGENYVCHAKCTEQCAFVSDSPHA